MMSPERGTDADKTSARAKAIHTSYARTPGLDWTAPMYFLLGPAPTAPQGPLPGPWPDARAITSTTAPAGSNSAASTATMASTAPAADNPARDLRTRNAERHHVLQLVTEAISAARLIEAGPSPYPATQNLIGQPAVHQDVE